MFNNLTSKQPCISVAFILQVDAVLIGRDHSRRGSPKSIHVVLSPISCDHADFTQPKLPEHLLRSFSNDNSLESITQSFLFAKSQPVFTMSSMPLNTLGVMLDAVIFTISFPCRAAPTASPVAVNATPTELLSPSEFWAPLLLSVALKTQKSVAVPLFSVAKVFDFSQLNSLRAYSRYPLHPSLSHRAPKYDLKGHPIVWYAGRRNAWLVGPSP